MHKLQYPLVLVDLEYTAFWRSLKTAWTKPNHHKEIVQIWAIKIDINRKEIGFLDVVVKPKINPKLTKRFINLTNITQEKVDKDWVDFKEALDKFVDFSKWYNICAYGWDFGVFEENCKLYGLDFPFADSPFCKVNEALIKWWIDKDKYTSWTLYKAVWAKMEWHHVHNALHDVRSMAVALKKLI